MQVEEKIKMFNDVFAPKSGEKVLFLVDMPHDDIKDNKNWSERREMANEWYEIFKDMGNEKKEEMTRKQFVGVFKNCPWRGNILVVEK